MAILDRFTWSCRVCVHRTSRRHTRCRVCGAVRDDVLPFPRVEHLGGTEGSTGRELRDEGEPRSRMP